jgi:hypothetical protein
MFTARYVRRVPNAMTASVFVGRAFDERVPIYCTDTFVLVTMYHVVQ